MNTRLALSRSAVWTTTSAAGRPNTTRSMPVKTISPARMAALRRANETDDGAFAAYFRFLELGRGDCPVESGPQRLGRFQGDLDAGPGPGIEARVHEVE